MPTIFSGGAGRAALVLSPGGAPVRLGIDSWQGYQSFKAIFTGVGVSRQSNQQFLHTLGGNIYVYVFGERMGEIRIDGIGFADICEGSENLSSGLDWLSSYYDTFRISMTGLPVTVALGAFTVVQAFLIGMNYQIVDPQTGTGQFSLRLAMPPTAPGLSIPPADPSQALVGV